MGDIVKIGWRDVEGLVNDVYRQLLDIDFKPDCIVGIARGGLTPAVLFSHLFDCRSLCSLQFQRTHDETPFSLFSDENIFLGGSLPDEGFQNILIVDDIIVTGMIFDTTIDMIRNRYNPQRIVGGFLYSVSEKYHNINQHQYKSSKTVDDSTWIVFPWENESAE